MRIRTGSGVGSAVARTPDGQLVLGLTVLAVGYRALQQPDETQRDADVEDVAAECLRDVSKYNASRTAAGDVSTGHSKAAAGDES